ncbi:MAG: methyltransferase domain-containing protein [Pseudomonadota bacterium]
MSDEFFYHNHWREIEEERLARYEEMFVYRPGHDPMLAPLDVGEGMVVVDHGSGPGFMAMEFARRVGIHGKVYGLDINTQFLARASERAADEGLTNIEFLPIKDEKIPLPDHTANRLFCKNVLEYVPDAAATLAEQHRVLKPGGRIELVDSDWGFVVVEPWGKARTDAFFEAARPAFNELYIGRKLPALLVRGGFSDVEVKLMATPDMVGGGLNVLTNMATYVKRFGAMEPAAVDAMMAELKAAIDTSEYLFVLPQFVVTANRG